MEHLMTEREVAAALALSLRTIQAWRAAGQGPAFLKLGGAVRYSPSAVARFVAAGERSSTRSGPIPETDALRVGRSPAATGKGTRTTRRGRASAERA